MFPLQQTTGSGPVSTLEEFMKQERLTVWPVINDSETIFEVDRELDDVRSTDAIVRSLRDGCPIATDVLDKLQTKISALEERLGIYADVIMTSERQTSEEDQIKKQAPLSALTKAIVQRSVLQRAAKSDAVRALPKQSSAEDAEMRAMLLGSKSRSVELTTYPGFKASELTELPHGVEAPHLLDRVTRAQEFNTGFNKFWRKLFLSEASVAVMQDVFWWFFIEKYQKQSSDDQKKIFNRTSDSFVALFNSVNPDIKDKFFAVYSDCLAQAVFAAYWEAFLDSHKQFDTDFKQEITSLCSEWIAGVKSQPGSYTHWNVQKLQPRSMNREQVVDPHKVVLIKDGKVNKQADFSISFDLPDTKALEGLDLASYHDSYSVLEAVNFSNGQKTFQNRKDVSQPRRLSHSSPATPRESHPVGPGPEFERVKFNLKGRSPLVAHYLHMRGLASNDTKGRSVRRTEVAKLQTPAPTYREVIRETKKLSKSMHHKYQESVVSQSSSSHEHGRTQDPVYRLEKISDILARELAAIERQRIQHTKEIDNLKAQLQHHATDMKIMSEKILDSRERDGNTARRQAKVTSDEGQGKVATQSSSSSCTDEESSSDDEDQ